MWAFRKLEDDDLIIRIEKGIHPIIDQATQFSMVIGSQGLQLRSLYRGLEISECEIIARIGSLF
jgi:hypothetical protein